MNKLEQAEQLLKWSVELFNDVPNFRLRNGDRKLTSYGVASAIDAYFRENADG